ncbi:hypothetical protein BDD43_0888 [Mucilaginibacter gracilis]|uniref:HEPN AbiU2-like domain-containing protein n=1 Tax=Mucilaginibacter gracilis TaxID=423350 RepID=A0A495IXH2_9SPHI|nr:hypothetical protein [Mucilaginibacter gracilis]RKR80754.1 hypothetical protein BDD43_0888 [Mucilaginibacter gracilis]
MRKTFKIEDVQNPLFFEEFKDRAIKIDSPILDQFSNYCMILEDLRTVIELNKMIEDLLTEKYFFIKQYMSLKPRKITNQSIENLKNEIEVSNTLLIQSLFTTVVITYSKWFTKSNSGQTSLDFKKVYNQSTRFHKVHGLIMQYRNKYFAHGEKNSFENAFPIYFPNNIEPQNDFLTFLPTKKRIPNLQEVKKFHTLFVKAYDYVCIQYKKTEHHAKEVMRNNRNNDKLE